MTDSASPVDPAEATAEALRNRLDRIADHLNRATHGLEQLGAALGLKLQPKEQEMTIHINEWVRTLRLSPP